MRRNIRITAAVLGLVCCTAAQAQVAVRGARVWTMASPPLEQGVVLIADGKITAVGSAADIVIPPDYEVLEAAVVTPGLIDAHSVVGLTGILNQEQDQDQLERSEALQPELRAVDAYNPQDPLVVWLREFGITTVHTGHAPGLPISGQTMIVKTAGETVEQAVRVPLAMVAVTVGSGSVAGGDGSSLPGTRAKVLALLRSQLVKAGEYLRKQEAEDPAKRPDRDLRLEALSRVLKKEVPLLITAERSHDIVAALRLVREFKVRAVLDGAAEAYMLTEQIKQAELAVILHPTMARPQGRYRNMSVETAARLKQAGILFAFQSGYEGYVPKTRVVLFEAAIAAANGLGFEPALRAVTLDAARILGIDKFVGSLEVGKDADLALYDGDPFEYTSHCVGVIIDGQIVSRVRR